MQLTWVNKLCGKSVLMAVLPMAVGLTATNALANSCPAPSFSPIPMSNSTSNSFFQGVTLNKTMQLLNGIDEIKGATYDPVRGEIVFLGQGELALNEQIDLDDLVVAIRSVYEGNAPGVTFDQGQTSLREQLNYARGYWDVQFYGATENTKFGQVLYEADYLLKLLTLGIDPNGAPLTNRPEIANLGFESYAEKLFKTFNSTELPEIMRQYAFQFWFRPKAVYVKLDTATENKSFMFDDANPYEMEVAYNIIEKSTRLTADPSIPEVITLNNLAAAFTSHINTNYDAYSDLTATFIGNDNRSHSFSILKRLKRLGRVTAVVHWLRDNEIPVDLSFLQGYEPKTDINTPKNVKILRVCENGAGNGIDNGGTYVDYVSCNIGVNGGIDYDLGNAYSTLTDPSLLSSALTNRPSQDPLTIDELKWDVPNTIYHAVSQSVAPEAKDGRFAFSNVDLGYPNKGGAPLTFQRYYDSFDWLKGGFGPGWAETPYTLKLPSAYEAHTLSIPAGSNIPGDCSNGDELAIFPNLNVLDRTQGRTVEFKAAQCLTYTNNSGATIKRPYYIAENSNDRIYEYPYGGYFIYIQMDEAGNQQRQIWFKERVTALGSEYIADVAYIGNHLGNGNFAWLEFIYEDNRLVRLQGENNQEIEVKWEDNRISGAEFSSPDGVRSVGYSYYQDGTGKKTRLDTVSKQGRTFKYSYTDADDHRIGVIQSVEDQNRVETIVSVNSDIEDRARSLTPEDNPELEQTVVYDRAARTVMETDSRGESFMQRDDKNRLLLSQRKAAIGTKDVVIKVEYDYQDARATSGPTTVTRSVESVDGSVVASRSAGIGYGYDDAGRVISVTDAKQNTTSIAYGFNGNATSGATVVVVSVPKIVADLQQTHSSVKEYDASGRMTAYHRWVTNLSSAPCSDDTSETCFTYTPQAGYSVEVDYDPASGGADKLTYVTGGTFTVANEVSQVLERNEFGQPELVSSATGKQTNYLYDGLARLKSSQGPADVVPAVVRYHESGLNQDKVASVSDAIGDTQVNYDVVTRTKRVTASTGITTAYIHNRKNQLERVVEVAPGNASVLTTQYFYDVFGQLDFKILPNNTRVEYDYDNHGRMTAMREVENGGAGNSNAAPIINQAPAEQSNLVLTSSGGSLSGFTISASDSDTGDTLTYNIVSAPEGLTFDFTTGVINWTPGLNQAGTHDVVIQVSDGNGGIADVTFTITVAADASVTNSDTDAFNDGIDNCVNVGNPDQRDTDLDGYGNACDGDLNNDGIVNFADMAVFKSVFGSTNSDADFDGDGSVDTVDLDMLEGMFGSAPGPSGRVQ